MEHGIRFNQFINKSTEVHFRICNNAFAGTCCRFQNKITICSEKVLKVNQFSRFNSSNKINHKLFSS